MNRLVVQHLNRTTSVNRERLIRHSSPLAFRASASDASDSSQRDPMQVARLAQERLHLYQQIMEGASHDLRNSLSTLIGNVDLAFDMLPAHSEPHELLAHAKAAGLHARRLLNLVMAMSRGEKPDKQIMSLTPLIQDAVELGLTGSGIKVECNFAPELYMAHVNATQIQEVLINLAFNARDAKTVSVHVRAENLDLPQSNPLQLAAGSYIHITVTDHGSGIQPENLAHIFELHFTTKKSGSGVGLFHCQEILRDHLGEISVESKPTGVIKSTTFHLYLPAVYPASHPASTAAVSPTPTNLLQGKRILVMDDDENVRKIFRNIITRFGCQVEVVADLEEATRLYEEALQQGKRFDAFLADLTGGQRAIQIIKTLDPQANVMVVSGLDDEQIKQIAAGLGCQHWLCKPFSIDGLQSKMANLFAGKSA